ncbi:YigZ family protein [Thiospirochaeta perfilievii]|uniref:YigZ family protein n=1 Tax=Thiospirochaeta perfilievii TaxID=252967 RepID=A0A5C1QDK0_9SPIO|nr:YigZ family protein [Thiospirochaeta perfilievii]QEN04804.1 YigZ family protein [Thiospirochaeta perfilievii]
MVQIPTEEYITQIEIKKSKFIGIGVPIESVDDARSKLSNLKKEYMDARHICYGFVWGEKSTHMGMSDDGEPHGTAGMPILEVVKGSGYENFLVAVVRYFGGTKLGTGGLVKAYTEITQEVVKGIPVEVYIEKISLSMTIPYTLYNQVKILFDEYKCQIINENFDTDITVNFSIPLENMRVFEDKIKNLSKGCVTLTKG